MQDATIVNDSFAKDAIIAWFRGEFAAANAIIHALCGHLAQFRGGYDRVFEGVHRRRMNWISVLQMHKYHSIVDLVVELGRVVVAGAGGGDGRVDECLDEENNKEGKEVATETKQESGSVSVEEAMAKAAEETEAAAPDEEDNLPNSDITDAAE